jgi:hypothetical protein
MDEGTLPAPLSYVKSYGGVEMFEELLPVNTGENMTAVPPQPVSQLSFWRCLALEEKRILHIGFLRGGLPAAQRKIGERFLE